MYNLKKTNIWSLHSQKSLIWTTYHVESGWTAAVGVTVFWQKLGLTFSELQFLINPWYRAHNVFFVSLFLSTERYILLCMKKKKYYRKNWYCSLMRICFFKFLISTLWMGNIEFMFYFYKFQQVCPCLDVNVGLPKQMNEQYIPTGMKNKVISHWKINSLTLGREMKGKRS